MAIKESDLVRVADLPAASDSARLKLRLWLRAQVQDEDRVDTPALVKAALDHFLPDTTFTKAFTQEKLPAMVYDEAQRLLGSERAQSDRGEAPDGRGGVAATKSKWHRWFEHVGDRHVRLTAMTKLDLLIAAEERSRRGTAELIVARHWQALAAGMETDWETVGQRFSEAEIDAALESAQGE